MMEQGEIEASPDVVYVGEDESDESEYDSRRVVKNRSRQEIEIEDEEDDDVDDDIGPTIKPPQPRSKKEKTKHKSRRDKKRSDEKSRERHSRGSRRSDPDRRTSPLLFSLNLTLTFLFNIIFVSNSAVFPAESSNSKQRSDRERERGSEKERHIDRRTARDQQDGGREARYVRTDDDRRNKER